MVNKIDLLHDGEFIELIENSSSTAEVLKTLGYSVKGNSWAYRIVSERMNKLNVHFGKKLVINSQGKQEKLPLEKILTTDSEYNRTKLKDRLIREGLKEYRYKFFESNNIDEDKVLSIISDAIFLVNSNI